MTLCIHQFIEFSRLLLLFLYYFSGFFIFFPFILIQFTDSHKHSSMLFALFRHYTSVQILNLVFLMCRFDFRIYELYTNIFIPLFYTFWYLSQLIYLSIKSHKMLFILWILFRLLYTDISRFENYKKLYECWILNRISYSVCVIQRKVGSVQLLSVNLNCNFHISVQWQTNLENWKHEKKTYLWTC